MKAKIRTACLFAIAIIGYLAATPATAQNSDNGKHAIDAWLSKVLHSQSQQNSNPPVVDALGDGTVNHEFLSYHFYTVRFRSMPPSPFKYNNLLVVSSTRAVSLITDERQLQTFFQSDAPPAGDEGQLRELMRAWLIMFKALREDGYLLFTIPEESISAGASSGGMVATGKLEVIRGGTGDIETMLQFDSSGRVAKTGITENIKVAGQQSSQ